MKSKKGISAIIGYVLLLGLAVALGMFVTSWYLKSSGSQSEQVLTAVEGGLLCEEVSINMGFDYENCKVKVKNTGKFIITKFDLAFSGGAGVLNPSQYTYKEAILPRANAESLKLPFTKNQKNIKVSATLYITKDSKLLSCAKEKEYISSGEFKCPAV